MRFSALVEKCEKLCGCMSGIEAVGRAINRVLAPSIVEISGAALVLFI